MKDRLGNEVKVGDKVAYAGTSKRGDLRIGTIEYVGDLGVSIRSPYGVIVYKKSRLFVKV